MKSKTLNNPTVVALISTLLAFALVILLLILLSPSAPDNPNAPKPSSYREKGSLKLAGNSFVPAIFGNGGYIGDSALITKGLNGRAILYKKQRVEARAYRFVTIKVSGNEGIPTYLLWRKSDKEGSQYQIPLPEPKNNEIWVDTDQLDGWEAQLQEIGIGFFDLEGQLNIRLDSIELQSYTKLRMVNYILDKWRSRFVINQKSLNWIDFGGISHYMSATTLSIAISLIGSILILACPGLNPSTRFNAISMALLLMWFTLDGLWVYKLAGIPEILDPGSNQVIPLDKKEVRTLEGFKDFVQRSKTHLVLDARTKLVLIASPRTNNYLAYLASYLLQPVNHQIIYEWNKEEIIKQISRESSVYFLDMNTSTKDHLSPAQLLKPWGICADAVSLEHDDKLRFFKLSKIQQCEPAA